MELDDLKKTWKTVDEKLQQQTLLTDEEVMKIAHRKRSNAQAVINKMLRDNLLILLCTVLLLAYCLASDMVQRNALGGLLLYALPIVAAIALPWGMYTMRYLHRTNVTDMPLKTVIARINRYRFWMSMERVAGVAILLFFALASIIRLRVWTLGGWLPWVLCGIWVVGFVVYMLLVNRMVFRRLKSIAKNLEELKEIEE